MKESAARRTMNPQRMAMLQRFLGRSKAKPTIVQQVHGNVEDPYFVPTEMENPPMRTETSYPQGENDSYYETIDFDFPYTQAQVDEHNRRFNIQQGEPMDMDLAYAQITIANSLSFIFSAICEALVNPALFTPQSKPQAVR